MPHDRPLILLVDNHADTRDMYAEYLHVRGFRVIACSDSTASIDFARKSVPDIILLELRMTGMNGAQVLAELRKDPTLAHVPVVALTASVLTCERAAAMAAGFTELVPKPCFPEDLVTAITRIIGASKIAQAPHDGLRPGPTSREEMSVHGPDTSAHRSLPMSVLTAGSDAGARPTDHRRALCTVGRRHVSRERCDAGGGAVDRERAPGEYGACTDVESGSAGASLVGGTGRNRLGVSHRPHEIRRNDVERLRGDSLHQPAAGNADVRRPSRERQRHRSAQ
jgi:two-component system cell cycle response regulator DivK